MLEEGRMGMLLFIYVTTNSLLHLGQQWKKVRARWIKMQRHMMIASMHSDCLWCYGIRYFSDDKYDLTELCLGNKKKKVTENVHIFFPYK